MELINQTICLTRDIGANGNMFGGEVMSLIDISAATYASEICKYPRMVTLKITETLFRKPIKVGYLIKVYGEVTRVGNTSITIKIEVRAHNVRTDNQTVVCETDITFVKIDEDGSPIPINSKVKELYPDKIVQETNRDKEEIARLLAEIKELKDAHKKTYDDVQSVLHKKINRVVKHATNAMKSNTSRKRQITQFNNFVRFLLTEKRITKEEIEQFITKKSDNKNL